ncbi:ABC transporter substrate-binding protein/permease [Aerococcus urinae]|uniref:ABC transporter substrate-binding protein/permease n=1 Tax=Aerococcus urinae TaxID=1376 RepID=UPI0025502946|nr:ABC transporter substrate-binding protein/permease [Aerococcus urinae]MDK6651557.1 ABC transporter substrate-binding protein/permease [Aerococcus urinae]
MSLMKKLSHCFLAVLLMLTTLSGLLAPQVYGEEGQGQAPSENSLLQSIKDRGELRMGVSPDYPPFEFITMKDGQQTVAGADIELGQKIADDLGVKLNVVTMEFSSLLSSMEAGNIAIIISGMGYTEERAKSVDFSDGYQNDEQAIIIRKDDAEKIHDKDSFTPDMTVGYQQGSIQEGLANEQMAHVGKHAMQQLPDLISALLTGQIDGVIIDSGVGGAHVRAHEDALEMINGHFKLEDDNSKRVVMPKNQPDLQAAINQSVQEVKDQGLMDQWLDESYDLIISEGQEQAEQGVDWLSYWPYYWNGIKTTLLISAVSVVFGLTLGAILAVMRLTENKILSGIAMAYVEFIRGTPLMIQVLFMFLGIGGLFNVPALLSALIAVSLNSGAYISEIIRGGIQAVDKGQTEAARSLGLDRLTTLKKVIFPQSLRSIWPALGNEFVTLIKESSIVSTIGIAELTFQTRAVTSITYQGIIPLLISMVIYFILTFTLTKFLNRWEKQMNAKYA